MTAIITDFTLSATVYTNTTHSMQKYYSFAKRSTGALGIVPNNVAEPNRETHWSRTMQVNRAN